MREGLAVRGFEEWAPTYDETIAKEVEQYGSITYADLLKKVILWAELARGMRILDAGAGTGLLCIEIARLLGPMGEVVGLDITPAMIERARVNIEKSGLSGCVKMHRASAMDIPYPEASFDRIVSSIAMHHTDVPIALAEMLRVLKPGGALVIADMGASPAWRTAFGRVLVPVLMFLYLLSKGFGAQAKAEIATFDQTYLAGEW